MSTIATLVACKNARQGEIIAKALVSERLAACVNIVPRVTSIYRWAGKVCRDAECLLVIKSRSANAKKIEKRVAELHSYDVPEVIHLRIGSGSPAYLRWLREST
jgi:periplasmic divalent cation tolerance protein